jgi:hypothetical protein
MLEVIRTGEAWETMTPDTWEGWKLILYLALGIAASMIWRPVLFLIIDLWDRWHDWRSDK